jgi:hypothetical protein
VGLLRARAAWHAAGVRSERGQTTVEWLGGTAVVLALVLLVLGTRPGLADALGCQVRAQIDRVISIEQAGTCDAPRLGRAEDARRARLRDLREASAPTGAERVRRVEARDPAAGARATWRRLVDGEAVVREAGGTLRVRFAEGGGARLRPPVRQGEPWRVEVVEHPALDRGATWTFEFR